MQVSRKAPSTPLPPEGPGRALRRLQKLPSWGSQLRVGLHWPFGGEERGPGLAPGDGNRRPGWRGPMNPKVMWPMGDWFRSCASCCMEPSTLCSSSGPWQRRQALVACLATQHPGSSLILFGRRSGILSSLVVPEIGASLAGHDKGPKNCGLGPQISCFAFPTASLPWEVAWTSSFPSQISRYEIPE